MSNSQNIFSPTSHLSNEQMVDFLNHRLMGKELHEVEKHLVDCSFCNEALEGLKRVKQESTLFAITDDLQRLARKRKLIKRKIFSQFDLISLFGLISLILFLIVVAVVIFMRK